MASCTTMEIHLAIVRALQPWQELEAPRLRGHHPHASALLSVRMLYLSRVLSPRRARWSKVADDVVDGQPAEVEEPIKWSSLSAPADFTDISPPPSDKSEQPDSVPQTPIKGLIAARPCRQSQRKLDSSFGTTDVDDSDGPPVGQVAMGKLLMMEAQELHKIRELMRLPEDERVGVVGHRSRANELRMMVNCEQRKIGGTVRASSVQLEARQESLVKSLMRAHKLSDGWHYKEIALEAAGLPDAVKAARAIELQEWQQLRKHTEGVCMALSDQAAGISTDCSGMLTRSRWSCPENSEFTSR